MEQLPRDLIQEIQVAKNRDNVQQLIHQVIARTSQRLNHLTDEDIGHLERIDEQIAALLQ